MSCHRLLSIQPALGCATGALFALLLTAPPQAQPAVYPDKPVKWVVDGAGGSPSDVLARRVGRSLSEAWRQPIVVDNKPGASGTIAYGLGARSPADGYTLVSLVNTLPINVLTKRALPYSNKDFAPVALFFTSPNVVVVPVNSTLDAKRYLDAARQKRQDITFATSGIGTSAHMTGEIIGKRSGVQVLHVPMTGSGPAMNEVMAGRVDFAVVNLFAASPQIRAGKLRALLVTSSRRNDHIPDVPTAEEAGVGRLDVASWFGVGVPAGVPEDLQRRLHGDIDKILASEDFRAFVVSMGGDPLRRSFREVREFYEADMANWRQLIQESGIPVEAN